MRQPARASVVFSVLIVIVVTAAGAESPRQPQARHPNLLLNQDEIERIKAKVRQHAWAAKLLEQMQTMADEDRHTEREPREAALVYVITGQRRYADRARQALLSRTRAEMPKFEKADLKVQPEFGAWGPWAPDAWAYDLTYDTFSDEERQAYEQFLRTVARTIIAGNKIRCVTQGLVFEKHWKVAIVGYCLGDRELIDWGLRDPGVTGPGMGGIYTVLDANVRDQMFWSETPRYGMGTVLHGFLAVAEAALHYDGTDLYHYVSPTSGGSIKGLLDGYLRITYPREKTGLEGGSLRLVTYGDGSTGYTATGQQTDTFVINPVPGGPKAPVSLQAEFEIAYKRYQEPGYAWLVGLNPRREGRIGGTRSVWGLTGLTHGEPLPPKKNPPPPPAPSGVYPSQGLAVLRSDESGDFWTGEATMAAMRLGASVGHGHNDYFHLLLHGKGRLLYPTIQLINYEPHYMNWTREGHACNLLLVDHQSPRPGECATRQDFAPEAKFFAVTGSAFQHVTQTRALLVTPQYVADVFHAADAQDRRRTFDWVLHGLGRLYPGNPAAYRPTHALVPFYWWIDNERGRTTAATWQADWVQHSGGIIPGAQPIGKEWFEQTAAVRMTMLGQSGTEVYCGDAPMVDAVPYAKLDGNPEGTVPLVLARRQEASTTFAAVHEPYVHRPALHGIRRIGETPQAIGMAIDGDGFSDRVLVAFGDGEQTLAGDEFFRFRDHAYVRIDNGQVVARGPITAFRVDLGETHATAQTLPVVVNGKQESARREGRFAVFGAISESGAASSSASSADEQGDSAERAAGIHYSFLPEEVHLQAGDEGHTTVHLRCVGQTPPEGMSGRLRFVAPEGIAVEPLALDVAGMREGEEKEFSLKFMASPDLAADLYPVRIEPIDGAAAASSELTVSVGVVITPDKRLPLLAQSVIRAPGYTMRLDHRSGVSYYLLDADGHRRHGLIGDDTAARTGFFAVALDERWLFHYYREPCRFVFEGQHDGTQALTLVSCGSGHDSGDQIRLRYTYHEDRIVATIAQTTDPSAEYEMWLGEFDALGEPLLTGSETVRKGKDLGVVSPAVFFPHPLYRQGVLLTFPSPRPIFVRPTGVHFPARLNENIELCFTEPDQLPECLQNAPPAPLQFQKSEKKSGGGKRGEGQTKDRKPK